MHPSPPTANTTEEGDSSDEWPSESDEEYEYEYESSDDEETSLIGALDGALLECAP